MKTINIVIIEDNKEIADLLKDYFETQEDLNVVGVAFNGIEGLTVLKETNPDVILLDIIMPKLDGIGVLEELKKENNHQDKKIIMLTALGQENVTSQAISLGASYFLMKPFDLMVLANRIRQSVSLPYHSETEATPLTHAALDQEITRILHSIGFPVHLKGYAYLRECIKMVYYDVELLSAVTKIIYPEVGRIHETSPTSVERAIRHSIDVTWKRGSVEDINQFFTSTLDTIREKPTNSELMAMVADKIRVNHLAS